MYYTSSASQVFTTKLIVSTFAEHCCLLTSVRLVLQDIWIIHLESLWPAGNLFACTDRCRKHMVNYLPLCHCEVMASCAYSSERVYVWVCTLGLFPTFSHRPYSVGTLCGPSKVIFDSRVVNMLPSGKQLFISIPLFTVVFWLVMYLYTTSILAVRIQNILCDTYCKILHKQRFLGFLTT